MSSGLGREGQRVIYIKSDSTSTSDASCSTTPSSSQASSGRCTPTNQAAAASSSAAKPDADKVHASLQSEFLRSVSAIGLPSITRIWCTP